MSDKLLQKLKQVVEQSVPLIMGTNTLKQTHSPEAEKFSKKLRDGAKMKIGRAAASHPLGPTSSRGTRQRRVVFAFTTRTGGKGKSTPPAEFWKWKAETFCRATGAIKAPPSLERHEEKFDPFLVGAHRKAGCAFAFRHFFQGISLSSRVLMMRRP